MLRWQREIAIIETKLLAGDELRLD